MASFEDVLDGIGSSGHFQIRAVILANLFLVPVSWSIMLPIFSAAVPDFRCSTSGQNTTEYDAGQGMMNGNMTLYGNESKGACTADNEVCPGVEYTSQFTSVISEVSTVQKGVEAQSSLTCNPLKFDPILHTSTILQPVRYNTARGIDMV